MSESILLKFLQNGLIDVSGDDVKFEKIAGTAGDFAQVLKTAPSKAVSSALLAFDQRAPASDPIVVEVLELLKKRWPTYMNTFSGVPVAVVRAVLLDALVQAANENEKVAIGFASAARNVLPFLEVGSERDIWRAAVSQIETLVDRRAEVEWATPEAIRVDKLQFTKPAPMVIAAEGAVVKRDWLEGKVLAASGPSLTNATTEGQNQYWPNQNPQAWAQQFGTKMAAAVADAIDAVAAKSMVQPVDLTPTFEKFANEVSAYAVNLFSSFSGATTGLQRRTQLLWWKEALFSPSARVSYRSLDDIGAATLMAFDLFQQIPMLSPASVQSFLAEAVRIVEKGDSTNTTSLEDLVLYVASHKDLEAFRDVCRNLAPPIVGGRGYLISLLPFPEEARARDDQQFLNSVGVSGHTKLSLSDWAEWIFRELQAARATVEDNSAKRKSRKGDDPK